MTLMQIVKPTLIKEPTLLKELGLKPRDYYKIAYNIKKMQSLDLETRKKFIEKANQILTQEEIRAALKLIISMAYDKDIYEITGLNYSEGPPEEEVLFSSAVAEYLLRKRK